MMTHQSLRVGLIGYGTIAQEVKRLVDDGLTAKVALVGALVRHPDSPRPVDHPPLVTTLPDLLAKEPQVIVEVAGQTGLREHGGAILRAGVDLYCISPGALVDQEVFIYVLEAAQQGGACLKVLSGAIGALDALAAASIGGFHSVKHTIHHPASSLLSSEDLARMREPQGVFRGTARQAVLQFPKLLNTAAAVALAGFGFDQTEVQVIADPSLQSSTHEIVAEGPFGKLRVAIENVPHSPSLQTIRLVSMSIVHALVQRHASLRIG